jgi:cell wall-associated NlpC family hydrolase
LVKFIDVPYVFGGQDEKGLDCSGLVVQAFKISGLPIFDRTAKQLYEDLFTLTDPPVSGPRISALFSFSKDSEVDHVAFVVGPDVVFHTTSSVGFAHFASRRSSIPATAEERFLNVFAVLEDTLCLNQENSKEKIAEKSSPKT